MSNRRALTDVFVRTIAVDRRTEFSDTQCPGLKLRVSKTGKKSFALKARDAFGTVQTVTLGEYPATTLRQARDAAQEARRLLREGKNFAAEKRARKAERSSAPTLAELIKEYQVVGSVTTKVWRPRADGRLPEAQSSVQRVFAPLLDTNVTTLTAVDFAEIMANYRPKQRGKMSANGSVSRARSYLSVVLDWAAHRKRFGKIGAGRNPALDVVDIKLTHDPAISDPSITGGRERVLTEDELALVLPLMTYPAPKALSGRLAAEDHLRPVAHRFILLTLARLREVAEMRWRDVDFRSGIWAKIPIDKRSAAESRRQRVPLSDAAMRLLKSLPGANTADPDDLVFPNSRGQVEVNWNRGTEAIKRASGTSGWTRHDLRRTSATILAALGAPIDLIADILGHSNRTKRHGLSGAVEHYVIATKILRDVEDPRKVVLDQLATVLDAIEARARDAGDLTSGVKGRLCGHQTQ